MKSRVGVGIGFQVADAEHVLAAANKHWPDLVKLGAAESERKAFAATIAEAVKVIDGEFGDQPGLEETRKELRDLVGVYRRAADLAANGMQGRNATLDRELRIAGGFPASDRKMRAYVTGLPAVVKKHAARLQARGLSKEDQARLAEVSGMFRSLLRDLNA